MSYTILVVEDEKTINENICAYLSSSGYKTISAFKGNDALDIFYSKLPDMVILDLMLPNISGEDVCKEIRKTSNIPIIMVTAKINQENIVSGIEIGADDYIKKPFSPKELVVRVNGIFRRINNFSNDGFINFDNGKLKINYDKLVVIKNNVECKLTTSERNIIFSLSKYPNKVFSRDELISSALGEEFTGYDRAIDSHIKNLRSKIEDNSQLPKYIITVRGIGYKFGDVL